MSHRVLVCGSRNWTDEGPIREFVESLPLDAVVLHGAARGADSIAGRLAAARGLTVEVMPAEWTVHAEGWCRCPPSIDKARDACSAAGLRRNQAMLERRPARAAAFLMPGSRGTWDMVRRLKGAGVPVYICKAVVR